MENNVSKKKHPTIHILSQTGKSDWTWGNLDGILILRTYKDESIMTKICRRNQYTVWFSLNTTLKKSNHQADIIILIDSMATPALIKWIKRKYKQARKILFCDNRVINIPNISLDFVRRAGFELWSYNLEDCLHYNMKHYNQFVDQELYIPEKTNIAYDAVFLGAGKDRIKEICMIHDLCEENGLKTWFFVPEANEIPDNACTDKQRMKYEDYIFQIQRSKAIIDIIARSNSGITWRPIEAMCLRKKLITNYSQIREEPLYNPNNIYIIGEETRSLKEFLGTPYEEIPDEIKQMYDVHSFYRLILAE